MNRFLRFLSFKPTPHAGSLLTFLQQCQINNGHIIFDTIEANDFNRRSKLNRLIKPLNLSWRERKTLIHDHLTPQSKFTITPNDIYVALNHPDQQAFPCQVCDNCAPGLFYVYCRNARLSDNNWCSQCHERGECLDVALIEHYRKHGIDDETISRLLPRKRWTSRGLGCPQLYQSIEDIEKTHQSVFKAMES
ncbi:hypothetical protein AB4396_00310 [Vibrio cyclitrophicus]|uniref:hypothetical protein n=1 Tax=Vibrio sp. R78045 TaxID=3093868 RepID=UPI0035543635